MCIKGVILTMRDITPRPVSAPQQAPTPSYLTHQEEDEKWTAWWYRLASPPRPTSAASFAEKDLFRRGRTGSQLIPALFVLLLASLPAGIAGRNTYLLPILIGCVLALIAAMLCNRLKMVTVAGFIVVATALAFPVVDILTTQGGINMLILPFFSLLIVPLVCSVSFLPEWSVFVVAVINIAFTLYALDYTLFGALATQKTAELTAILQIDSTDIVTPIVTVQIVIPIVAYLWVHGTVQALKRADRAEEIARLEHDMALQAEVAAQQKYRLEASIQKIVETHTRIANGDLNARVPLTEDNVLWQISGALNN